MTDHLAIKFIAVLVAITVMLVGAGPVASFIDKNPAIVVLALGFLLMIGATLARRRPARGEVRPDEAWLAEH